MSKDNRDRKPTNNIGRPDDTTGQNVFWPGDGSQQAGTIKDGDETTTIPVVDSVQQPTENQTDK